MTLLILIGGVAALDMALRSARIRDTKILIRSANTRTNEKREQ